MSWQDAAIETESLKTYFKTDLFFEMSQINLTQFAKMEFGIFEMLGKAPNECAHARKYR